MTAPHGPGGNASEAWRDRMVDYLYNALPAEDRRAFEQAMAAEPELRREVDALARTLRVSRSALEAAQEAAPSRVHDRVMAAASYRAADFVRAARVSASPEKADTGLLDRVLRWMRTPWGMPALVATAAISVFVFTRDAVMNPRNLADSIESQVATDSREQATPGAAAPTQAPWPAEKLAEAPPAPPEPSVQGGIAAEQPSREGVAGNRRSPGAPGRSARRARGGAKELQLEQDAPAELAKADRDDQNIVEEKVLKDEPLAAPRLRSLSRAADEAGGAEAERKQEVASADRFAAPPADWEPGPRGPQADGLASSAPAKKKASTPARPPAAPATASEPALVERSEMPPEPSAVAKSAPAPAAARPSVALDSAGDDLSVGALGGAPAGAAAGKGGATAGTRTNAAARPAPQPWSDLSRKADELRAQARYDEAIAIYRDLLKRFPSAPKARDWQRLLLVARDESARVRAREAARKATQTAPAAEQPASAAPAQP